MAQKSSSAFTLFKNFARQSSLYSRAKKISSMQTEQLSERLGLFNIGLVVMPSEHIAADEEIQIVLVDNPEKRSLNQAPLINYSKGKGIILKHDNGTISMPRNLLYGMHSSGINLSVCYGDQITQTMLDEDHCNALVARSHREASKFAGNNGDRTYKNPKLAFIRVGKEILMHPERYCDLADKVVENLSAFGQATVEYTGTPKIF